MRSFQDEIAAIRREANVPIIPIANTAADIAQFEKDSPRVVNTICDEIREHIREIAKQNRIYYNEKGFLFPRKVEPHYYTSKAIYIKSDKNIGFKYGNEEIRPRYDENFVDKCLYLKTPEFAIKIVESIVQQLEYDNIFPAERSYDNTRRITFPTESQLALLSKYFEGDTRALGWLSQNNIWAICDPTCIFLGFAYFLE